MGRFLILGNAGNLLPPRRSTLRSPGMAMHTRKQFMEMIERAGLK